MLWHIYIALHKHQYFPILYLMLTSFFFKQFNQNISVCSSSGSILFTIIWKMIMKHCMSCTWFCGWVYFCLGWFTEMFQCNNLNRHRYISTIIFWFYLVGKTINNPLSIIMAKKHILKWFVAFKLSSTRVATVICNEYLYHVEFETPTSGFME